MNAVPSPMTAPIFFFGEKKMTDQKLNELALDCWKDGWGDAMTAVKLLRERTGLGLREAAGYIEKTAHQVGGRYNLILITGKLPPAIRPMSREAHESDPRLAEHRARRGVKKVRGAK